MGRRALAIAAAVAILGLGCEREAPSSAPRAPEASPAGPETAILHVGGRDVEVDLAYRESTRTLGLLPYDELPADRGLLFVYPDERSRTAFTTNKRLPLTVAFLDGSGRITELADLDPDAEDGLGTFVQSSEPARFALQMIQGWYSGHGVKVGDVVAIPESVRKLPAEPEAED